MVRSHDLVLFCMACEVLAATQLANRILFCLSVDPKYLFMLFDLDSRNLLSLSFSSASHGLPSLAWSAQVAGFLDFGLFTVGYYFAFVPIGLFIYSWDLLF